MSLNVHPIWRHLNAMKHLISKGNKYISHAAVINEVPHFLYRSIKILFLVRRVLGSWGYLANQGDAIHFSLSRAKHEACRQKKGMSVIRLA